MEQVKAQICENITMYAQKYDEEFSSHLPGFVTTVWNLLINTSSHVKYDQVICVSVLTAQLFHHCLYVCNVHAFV